MVGLVALLVVTSEPLANDRYCAPSPVMVHSYWVAEVLEAEAVAGTSVPWLLPPQKLNVLVAVGRGLLSPVIYLKE